MLSSSSFVFYFHNKPHQSQSLSHLPLILEGQDSVSFAMDRYSMNVTLNPTWTPASSKEHNLDTTTLCLITAYLRKKHYSTYQSK